MKAFERVAGVKSWEDYQALVGINYIDFVKSCSSSSQ